jgi:hypothetical protein
MLWWKYRPIDSRAHHSGRTAYWFLTRENLELFVQIIPRARNPANFFFFLSFQDWFWIGIGQGTYSIWVEDADEEDEKWSAVSVGMFVFTAGAWKGMGSLTITGEVLLLLISETPQPVSVLYRNYRRSLFYTSTIGCHVLWPGCCINVSRFNRRE